MELINLVVVLALLATIGALGMGVISMGRGGDFDERHSDQFMFARVGLQGIAVVFMFVALYVVNF